MTPAQRNKYWAEFRPLKGIWAGRGMSPADIEQARIDIHCVAAGADFSERVGSDDLTEDQLSRVFEEFAAQSRAALPLEDAATAKLRRQLVWSIKQEQPSPTWARELSKDLWGTADWKTLPIKPTSAPKGFEGKPEAAWPCLLRLRRRVGNEHKARRAAV